MKKFNLTSRKDNLKHFQHPTAGKHPTTGKHPSTQKSVDYNQNVNENHPSQSQTDGFHLTTADQLMQQDLCKLKLNLFSMEITTRSKSLSNDLNEEAFNLKKASHQSQSVTTLQRPSRSPFTIRRVKAVKPDKITVSNNNNSQNGGLSSASKKRSVFHRRKSHSNDKSSYSSRDRRGLLFSSKNGRTSEKINFSDDNRSGTETPPKSTAASEKDPYKGDSVEVHVNKNTKGEEEGSSDQQQNNSSNDNTTKKNVLSLTLNLSDKSDVDELSDMESSNNNNNKPRRSASLKVPPRSAPVPLERKVSSPIISANHSTDSLPDLETPRTPNNSATRLKRDYHITDTEIAALRAIIKKADLYDQTVRERMFQVLKIDETDEADAEAIATKVVSDKEIESLKQRLFMSRKELDSYISFTKKMEREKRQSISEKEELETKIQWHERRLSRFENENKTLKQERANLMNQIYELRSKSSKESGHTRQKSVDVAALLSEQSELESSKQRFIHEADVFAQERTKYIKERQRLDEDNRKAHIRNVSLIAQVQHWEKTVKELETEKEDLKTRLSKMTRQSVDEQRKSISAGTLNNNNKLEKTDSIDETDSNNYSCLIETIKFDDSEINRLRKELESAEERYENLKNEFRNLEENQITIDHENMALRDTVNVLTNAKEDSDVRLNDIDTKYRESVTELKTLSIGAEELEKENLRLQKDFELVSSNLAELQQEAVEMELDQDAFKKFLEKLSMELQEKLGEEHVSKDTQADSLQEQAEIVGREIVAHLNPSRKLQEDYEAMKEDKEDLEEEIQFLKFALSNRMEIKSMQKPVEKCDCSKEKEVLKRDYEEAMGRLESLEDEVNRLHQDKQQLLMSFLNLQASQRSSRDVSRIDVGMTTDDDLSDEEGTQSSGSYHSSRRNTGTSSNGDTSDLQERLEDALNQIERLEIEREEMLESLCKQADANNALKDEIEDLKNGGNGGGSSSNVDTRPSSRTGSRPNSAISKSESMASISSERCPNCIENTNEIRKYLSIIEELTEDKLRLERMLNDLELDKDKAESDLAKLTEDFCQMESEMTLVDSEKESTVRSAKEETKLLLRNMQSLQEENQLLEENLKNLDEDRREVLQNLKQAEEDRLGFIRTLQLITEQKESVEEQVELLKAENETLKTGVTGNSIVSPSDLPKAINRCDDVINEHEESGGDIAGQEDFELVQRLLSQEQKADLHLALKRSISTPLGDSVTPTTERAPLERYHSTAVTSPREHPIRRADSVEDIATGEDENKELARQLISLKNEILLFKTKNIELNKSLERSNTLLREERKRRLSERSPATTPVKEYTNVEVDVQQQQQELPLNTITELPDMGERADYVPTRRLSGERRRSAEFKLSEELLTRPRLSSGSFISEDEVANRRKLYGQRKSSMSLDEMYNLFGVTEKNNMETKVLPM
ncbi:girdin-like isoform X4 [Clytia hemisphaerica]|uniref:Uncharacterized protein n=1 Tax=Clytia hemisphaerica TaxID=252671 RepID=A0A7M5WJF4_9CNID